MTRPKRTHASRVSAGPTTAMARRFGRTADGAPSRGAVCLHLDKAEFASETCWTLSYAASAGLTRLADVRASAFDHCNILLALQIEPELRIIGRNTGQGASAGSAVIERAVH